MKNLFIGLLAFALTLGVSCKKSNEIESVKPSKEVKKDAVEKPSNLKPGVLSLAEFEWADQDGGGIGGYPGGASTYPHNTGICYCGKYSVCHPQLPRQHSAACKARGGTGYECPGPDFCHPIY